MRNSMAQALFPDTRRAILAATLLEPERWWYMSDLARHLGVSPSSLQRELQSLVSAGILVRREEGRQVYFRADPECPVLSELQGIMVKTAGVADVLRAALASFNESIDCAFIYGSFAKGTVVSESDIDVMVIGEVGLSELSPALKDAAEKIGRSVNPTVYPAMEFAKKLASGQHFLSTVMREERLYLIGDENKLAETSGKRPGAKAPDKQTRAGRSARSR